MRTLLRPYREAFQSTRSNAREFISIARPIFRPLERAILVVLAFLLVGGIFDSIYPLLYGKLTDSLIAHNGQLAIVMILVLFAQSAVRHAIDYVRERYEIEHIDWKVSLRIMDASLERISGFSMSQLASTHTGKTMEIVRNGRSSMRYIVYLLIYRMVPTLLRLFMGLAGLLWFCWPVGIVALLGTTLYIVFAIGLFLRYRTQIKELENRNDENSQLFSDILRNMEVVQAYAQEATTTRDFSEDGKLLASQQQSFWRGALNWFYVRNGIAMVFRNLIMAYTAYLLFEGVFTFGLFVALTQWAMQAVGATQELGHMQRELAQSWAHIELYLQLLNRRPDVTSASNPVRISKLRGSISFRDVTFAYEPRAKDDPLEQAEPVVALNGVSFDILPGQKIALVGESGAGKSTVAYALMRARDPQSGSILIDGVDLREIELSTLRKRIGYVPQQPKLFSRTLRYNLTFGLEDPTEVTDKELRQVLQLLKLEKLAANGGLDSKLGESGQTLSGGERQRLCIARALIKDPNVLIFDEATSSLDPKNEKRVQEAIDVIEGRTVIIIAHRLSTIRHVDRILVFENGKLINDGTHSELMERSKNYRELLEQQMLV